MEEATVVVAAAATAGTCCCWVWDAAGGLARSKAGGQPFIIMLPSHRSISLPYLRRLHRADWPHSVTSGFRRRKNKNIKRKGVCCPIREYINTYAGKP